MLKWMILCAVVAIVFGLMGFVFHVIAGIAKLLFFLFLVGFVISLVMHVGRGKAGS
ncbi:MAG TPA: DUF1328 domain-containing protein [Caulobacteraceae bacterium]|nr:DUF1328 domain-containing protein [Caulobacteraceae bacterium]